MTAAIREALGEALEQRGFRTVLAADGGEAVELVQVDLVHLVLFDMQMPRLTGLEAFAVIRQTLDRVLPAVLMTADATNDLIRRAFQAQVFSVIPKPVNMNIVLQHADTRAGESIRPATPASDQKLPRSLPMRRQTRPTAPSSGRLRIVGQDTRNHSPRRPSDEDRPVERQDPGRATGGRRQDRRRDHPARHREGEAEAGQDPRGRRGQAARERQAARRSR